LGGDLCNRCLAPEEGEEHLRRRYCDELSDGAGFARVLKISLCGKI